jgi:hypothetical protein
MVFLTSRPSRSPGRGGLLGRATGPDADRIQLWQPACL